MYRKVILSILLALFTSCGEGEEVYNSSSVSDKHRTLGMIMTADGAYEFILCGGQNPPSTEKAMQENCINPLVDEHGVPSKFSSVPLSPNTTVDTIRNIGLTLLVGVVSGAFVLGVTRFFKKKKTASALIGEIKLARTKAKLDNAYETTRTLLHNNDDQQRLLTNRISEAKSSLSHHHNASVRNPDNFPHLSTDSDEFKQAGENIQKEIDALEEQLTVLQKQRDALTKRSDDIYSLGALNDDKTKVELNKELQDFILSGNSGLGKTEKYIQELTVLDEVANGSIYHYFDDGKYFSLSSNGEAKVLEAVEEAESYLTVRELAEKISASTTRKEKASTRTALKDRMNIQREKQRGHTNNLLKEIKASIVSKPVAAAPEKAKRGGLLGFTDKVADKVSVTASSTLNSVKRTFKYSDEGAYETSKVVKEVSESIEGMKISPIVFPVGKEKIIGQGAGVLTMVALTITDLSRFLPGHAKIKATQNWSDIVGDYKTVKRVSDMEAVLNGLAISTGSKVSARVAVFGL